MMEAGRFVRVLGAFVLLCGCIYSQTTTGTLLGTVSDPTNAAVPGAHVELTNTATGATNTTVTGTEGIFRFNSLEPANYLLKVSAGAGFKTYEQSNIEVTASEIRDLGKISLAMGQITEQVLVTAETTTVQTVRAKTPSWWTATR